MADREEKEDGNRKAVVESDWFAAMLCNFQAGVASGMGGALQVLLALAFASALVSLAAGMYTCSYSKQASRTMGTNANVRAILRSCVSNLACQLHVNNKDLEQTRTR